MDPISLMGYAAASLTTLAFLPQVHKTWRSGSARDLSLPTLGMMFSGVLLWLLYGIAQSDAPLAAANAATLALVSILVVLKLRDATRRADPR